MGQEDPLPIDRLLHGWRGRCGDRRQEGRGGGGGGRKPEAKRLGGLLDCFLFIVARARHGTAPATPREGARGDESYPSNGSGIGMARIGITPCVAYQDMPTNPNEPSLSEAFACTF